MRVSRVLALVFLNVTGICCWSCSGGGTPVVEAPEPQVYKPLFSTGSGPNDMVHGNNSLYVANSLDNTVVRYGMDGTVLSSEGFPESSSPSYLALDSNQLWVVANGSNTLTGLEATSFTTNAPAVQFELGMTEMAFPGPGIPAFIADKLAIPLAGISAFDTPTSYQAGSFSLVETSRPPVIEQVTLAGRNGQMALYIEQTDTLVVSSAGELQLDAEFNPSITTDSYLELLAANNMQHIREINLGPVGAGRFAVDPTGTTAYIGNSLNGNLYQVNLSSGTIVHGAGNPIVLTTEFTFISDVAYTPDGQYVLATSFNTDELYVIEAATGTVNPGPYTTPYDLSLATDLLAGCTNVEIALEPNRPGKYSAYVLYGVANAVAKVELH